MIREVFICYLLKINKGSEWLLGENAYNSLKTGNYIVTAKHQLEGSFIDGAIGSISYKRKNGKIAVIGMFGRKNEPKTPVGFRIDYLLWSIRVYSVLGKRAWRCKINHVNFAQLLTPIPKLVRSSKDFLFGPVGGQGPWYKVRFMPLKNRLVNYIIYEILYSIIFHRLREMNVIFVHPVLAERFGCGRVQPAIKLKNKHYIARAKKSQVVHVSRKVYFKLPGLHKKLFEGLAILHPEMQFIIVGAGWYESSSIPNLRYIDTLPRNQIIELFAESQFHLNLSLELAGFVNLEAASNKCITIGANKSGAEYLLGLNGKYLVDVYDSCASVKNILELISAVICNYDEYEAERQFEKAQQFTFMAE